MCSRPRVALNCAASHSGTLSTRMWVTSPVATWSTVLGTICSTHRDDNVQRELRDWGLSFDSNLLSFSGRILQSEKIHQGGKTVRLVRWCSG